MYYDRNNYFFTLTSCVTSSSFNRNLVPPPGPPPGPPGPPGPGLSLSRGPRDGWPEGEQDWKWEKMNKNMSFLKLNEKVSSTTETFVSAYSVETRANIASKSATTTKTLCATQYVKEKKYALHRYSALLQKIKVKLIFPHLAGRCLRRRVRRRLACLLQRPRGELSRDGPHLVPEGGELLGLPLPLVEHLGQGLQGGQGKLEGHAVGVA